MRYTTFGRRTGLRVSEYALGAGNFGTGWATGADRDESKRMLDRFAEAGGTFIDTAPSYQYGQSEALLGEFLANSRDRFVLASKFSRGADREPALLSSGNSRREFSGSTIGGRAR